MNPQQPAARSDVLRELGALDDLTIAEILELGPTVAALVEARIYLADEDPTGPRLRSPGPVVQKVVDLVRDQLAREEEEDVPVS
jgi:hypothetical protein